MSVLVVGAGISGVLAARHISEAGIDVTVVDKGRGVGGRMATRRIGDAVLDHGAQFLTSRDPSFAAVVGRLSGDGAVTVWFDDLLTFGGGHHADGEHRYRGVPSMTGPVKALAAGLDVRVATTVTAVEVIDGRWSVAVAGGPSLRADVVVLTAPVPQSLVLLDAGGVRLPRAVRSPLDRLVYDPCLAVLAVLDAPTALPPPGALRPAEEPVCWVADNHRKGISPVPAVTVHAGPHTTRDLWNEPDDVVVAHLLGAVRPLGVGDAVSTSVVRWRYATPIEPLADRCTTTTTPGPLVFAGDAFGGPRVEGAARSGLAAGAAATALVRGRGGRTT